jgi:ethanolamine utilization microcompartment shell protein EutL
MFTWVTTVLPFIVSAVRYAEKLFTGAGRGEEKIAMVLGILGGIMPEDADPAAKAGFLEGCKQVVSGIVMIFNATGIFKK